MNKYLCLLVFSLLLAGCTISPTLDKAPKQIGQAETNNSPAASTTASQVPLPSGMDVVNLFWQLINERRIPEAIAMMSDDLVPDDSTKQAYGVQFNAIESAQVTKIEPYGADNWTANRQTYQTTLEISVSDSAADAPIPFYGWADNPNIRFITLSKNQAGTWQIAQIGTGP